MKSQAWFHKVVRTVYAHHIPNYNKEIKTDHPLEWCSWGMQELQSKSNCTSAQYVSSDPASHNWMKKSQNMPVWLSKMALTQQFCTKKA
jgi:hypothetical protein